MVARSATQVIQDLNYKIPRVKPVIVTESKEEAKVKTNDEQKQKVELDGDGFKISQGIAHRKKKKLEADELDPSGYLVDMVKVRQELSPYGLSDKEWRCYLLHLVNTDRKNATLPQIAMKLVKELEPKISEEELIRDREKNPLEPKAMKGAKLYLSLIKQDRYKNKFLVDCFLANSAKRQQAKSASSDSGNDTKRQNQRAFSVLLMRDRRSQDGQRTFFV